MAMSIDVIRELKRLVPPPRCPRNGGSRALFREIERQLGFHLPDDYKEIVTLYGDGRWQDFWYLYNPFSDNRHLNLIKQSPRDDATGLNCLSAERAIRNQFGDAYPHAIWPETGGVFPWGVTDNGGRLFWRMRGDPARWPTVYYPSRDPDFRVLRRSTSRILLGAVTGQSCIFMSEFGPDFEFGRADAFQPLHNLL
jgi:hypothetical protein